MLQIIDSSNFVAKLIINWQQNNRIYFCQDPARTSQDYPRPQPVLRTKSSFPEFFCLRLSTLSKRHLLFSCCQSILRCPDWRHSARGIKVDLWIRCTILLPVVPLLLIPSIQGHQIGQQKQRRCRRSWPLAQVGETWQWSKGCLVTKSIAYPFHLSVCIINKCYEVYIGKILVRPCTH